MSSSEKKSGSYFNFSEIIRVICCLKTRTVKTENIDKIKKIYYDIKNTVDSSRDVTFLDRMSPFDLCIWSNQVLKCLAEVKNEPDTKQQTEDIIKHLETIKSFYQTVEKLKAQTIKNVNDLFIGIQYYECILSLAFIIFQEYPKTISVINEELRKIESLMQQSSDGRSRLRLSSDALKEVDDSLEAIDVKLGEFGLVSIAEFIADIIEVFCQYVGGKVDVERTATTRAHALIEKMIGTVGPKLKVANLDYDVLERRGTNWGLLPLSQRIQMKANQLQIGSTAIRKLIYSFERFYKSMVRLNDDFDKTFKRFNGMQFENANDQDDGGDGEENTTRKPQSDANSEISKAVNKSGDGERRPSGATKTAAVIIEDKMTNLIMRFDAAQIKLPYNVEMFMEVENIARWLQKLELVVSTLIMSYRGEENIIYPLVGHLDECTRIIEKYIRLNVVYKLVYGCNFLSKLKVVFARVDTLMETSAHVNLTSSALLVGEFRKAYPELMYVVFDSFINIKVKSQLDESNVDPVEKLVDSALQGFNESTPHRF